MTDGAVGMEADDWIEMRREIQWDCRAMSPATTVAAGNMAMGLLTKGASRR